MYQKIGKRSFNLLVLLVGCCLMVISVFMLWQLLKPPPRAIEVAAQHLDHMMSGDVDAIRGNVTETEKKLHGMSKQLLLDFYKEHIQSKLQELQPQRRRAYFTIKDESVSFTEIT